MRVPLEIVKQYLHPPKGITKLPAFVTQTLNMTAAKGYVIALTQPASLVDITARGACWIRAQADGIVPSAPAVTPAPAPDASCNYEYLAANDSISFGADAYYNSTGPATQDMTKYIIVWAEEPGYLTISAH